MNTNKSVFTYLGLCVKKKKNRHVFFSTYGYHALIQVAISEVKSFYEKGVWKVAYSIELTQNFGEV